MQHAWQQPGDMNVSVTVTDRDGGAGVASFAVQVANAPPVVTAAPAQSTVEGTSAALQLGSFADPGQQDGPWTVSIDWGDGSKPSTFSEAAPSALAPLDHSYAQSGSYTVAVTVTDAHGGAGQGSFAVSVANAPPALSAPANQGGSEGQPVNFDLGSFADAAGDGPWTVTVDWGDGSTSTRLATAPGALGAAPHAYADDGDYAIAVTVADASGLSSSAVFHAAVANTPPTASIAGAPASSAEGAAIPLTAVATDPGAADTAAGFTYAWTVTKDGAPYATGGAKTFQFTPDDDGVYVVSLAVTDRDGGTGTATATIAVQNVAPTATFVAPTSITEGADVVLSLQAPFDPSSADTAAGFEYAFDCGDGQGYSEFGPASSRTCPTDDDGARTVGGQLRDKNGATTAYTNTVVVADVAPTATFAGPPSVAEGSSATFAFSTPRDPSEIDTAAGFRYAYDCEGGSVEGASYASAGTEPSTQCSYADGPSDHTVRARIFDVNGSYTEYTASIHVDNVAPIVAVSATPQPSKEGAPVTVVAAFSDAGAHDGPFACAVDFGDGTSAAGAVDGQTCTAQHVYADDGVYMIAVAVTDKDGATGRATLAQTVDPVAPTALFGAPAAVDEGSAYTLSLSGATDPSSADLAAGLLYAFDCGDGAGYGAATAASSVTCAGADSGTRTVRGKVLDKDGIATEYTSTLAINDVAPTAVFSGPASVTEGGSAAFTFSAQHDPSAGDLAAGLRYAVDCAGGSLAAATYATASTSPTVTCGFGDGPATALVRARIFDREGGFSEYTATVQVLNAAPSAALAVDGGAAVANGTTSTPVFVSFTGATDASAADVAAGFRYAFDCRGGSLAGTSYATASASPSVSCLYDVGGAYTARGRIYDKDGGFTEATVAISVDDPGRMTGGGQLPGGVSHGFELHCDKDRRPNQLEVNWGKGNKFQLTTLTAAACSQTTSSTPSPAAPFDTLAGAGTGTLNGAPGYTATFKFVDAGEPGKNDTSELTLRGPTGAVVLSVSGTIQGGNHQAHKN
jgi:hypothetical protein